MCRLIGYLRTLRQYAATPKGRHDIRDYLYAGGTMLLVSALIWILLWIVR